MRSAGLVRRSLFGDVASGAVVLALTLTLGTGAALAQQEPQPDPAPPPPTSPPVSAPQGIPSTGNPRIDDLVTRVRDLFDSKREGFFPWLGGIMPGGWVAGGGGYRRTLARGVKVDARAGISIRNYKLFDAGVHVPVVADRFSVDVRTRLLDAPRVQFYGLGNDTAEADVTRFDYEPKQVDARLRFTPSARDELGATVGLLHVGTGPGSADPSIEQRFSPAEAPGLGESASYRTFGLYAQTDRRDARDFPRRGGWYRADWRVFADGGDRPYGHQRVDLDARQFFPIVDERQAVLVRGVFSGTRAADGDVVPHFLMPTLGDGEHLRGFANQRFADRHRLLLQGEYRYRLNDRLHVAGLVDLGRVAPRVADLSLGDMHVGYGAGIRAQTEDGMGMRVDIVRSREQWSFIASAVIF
jgi:hypothetical protein